MRTILTLSALILTLSAPLIPAQGWSPPPADEPMPDRPDRMDQDDPADLIGRGIGILLDNFMREVQPDLNRLGEDMSGALSNLGPVLGDLTALIDDLRNYQAPERLKNGDIIIRRRADAPPPPPLRLPPDQDQPPSVPRNPDAPEFEL